MESALEREIGVKAPPRLLELTGAGPNQWTAAEGALKVRETSRVATEGLSVEQFFHGPSVAVDERDTLVCLDGGGPGVGAARTPSRGRPRRAARASTCSRRRPCPSRCRSSR